MTSIILCDGCGEQIETQPVILVRPSSVIKEMHFHDGLLVLKDGELENERECWAEWIKRANDLNEKNS